MSMQFSTRPVLGEDECDDFADVPLKLHSLTEFLDSGFLDSTTEHQHVSSNDSESEEEAPESRTPKSLRLTPFLAAQPVPAPAAPRPCFCLDKAHCMCALLTLPPLFAHRASTAAPIALTSSTQDAPACTSACAPSGAAEGLLYAPLQLSPIVLTEPPLVAKSTQTAASTRTRTCTTCCRC